MGEPTPPRRLRIALASSAACALAVAAAPPQALHIALKALAAEAERHRIDPASLPSVPDFASRAQPVPEIETGALVEALTRRADRDPFTDAYIRWQLASLDPDLSALDAATFARLVREAPVLSPNPRADAQVIALFERVAGSGPLSDSDLERFRELIDRLEAETARAEALGRPAAAFHAWVQEKLGAHALRSRQWLLVRLAMTASAGWPVADLKSQVTEALGGAASDPALTDAHRALLARQVHALAGLEERRAVDQATFMADGRVRVTLSWNRVSDDDIDGWLERLAG